MAEVVAISKASSQAGDTCVDALAIKDVARGRSLVWPRLWSAYLKGGFNYDPDDAADQGIVAEAHIANCTKILSESLVDGFEFTLSEDIVNAPYFYGRYADDGNIVGILSSRVWTFASLGTLNA